MFYLQRVAKIAPRNVDTMCRILFFWKHRKIAIEKKKPQKNMPGNLEERSKILLKMQLSNEKGKCLLALHAGGSYLHSWEYRKQNKIKKRTNLKCLD